MTSCSCECDWANAADKPQILFLILDMYSEEKMWNHWPNTFNPSNILYAGLLCNIECTMHYHSGGKARDLQHVCSSEEYALKHLITVCLYFLWSFGIQSTSASVDVVAYTRVTPSVYVLHVKSRVWVRGRVHLLHVITGPCYYLQVQ